MDRRQFISRSLAGAVATLLPISVEPAVPAKLFRATFTMDAGTEIYGAVVGGGDMVPQIWSPQLMGQFYRDTVFDG